MVQVFCLILSIIFRTNSSNLRKRFVKNVAIESLGDAFFLFEFLFYNIVY